MDMSNKTKTIDKKNKEHQQLIGTQIEKEII